VDPAQKIAQHELYAEIVPGQKWRKYSIRSLLRSAIVIVLVARGLRILPDFAGICQRNLLIVFVFNSGFGTLTTRAGWP
jgi:hypothetical protein